MFPITRYGSKLDESTDLDKDSILKSLKKNAKKRNKLLKRKLEEQERDGTKISVQEEKEEITRTKDKVEEKFASPQKFKEKTIDNSKNDSCKIVTNNGAEEHAKEDASENVLESYNPLAMFKMGLKAPRQTPIQDLLKSAGEKLPEWLENPFYIETDLSCNSSFDISCFHELLQKNLKAMGIDRLFPVQTSLIPALLYGIKCDLISRPNDVCVCSPTGSGKTLAFAIPIIQYLVDLRTTGCTGALVIVPTIELAKQVHGVFLDLCQSTDISCVLLGGSRAFTEMKLLTRKTKFGFDSYPDVIVSTPGRLAHFLETPDVLNLESLRFLVIDEADRILDLIKQSWLRKLKQQLPQWQPASHMITLEELSKPKLVVQKLLFSATLSPDPEKLKDLDLFCPRLFIAKKKVKNHLPVAVKRAKYSIPSTLREHTVCCEANLKPLAVLNLLLKQKVKKALCFAGSADSARRLHLLMNEYAKNGILDNSCLEFSSLLSKKERKRNMTEFTTKSECILVSSDAVARGIDAIDIETVILYDLPQFVEAYVHRAGRASRAGKEGSVFSLVTQADMYHYKKLFKNAGLHLPQDYQIDEELNTRLLKHYDSALSNVQIALEKSKRPKR